MNRKLFLLIIMGICLQYFAAAQYITTILGDGTAVNAPDGAVAATSPIYFPRGAVKGKDGNIYFVEFWSNKIRMIMPDGTLKTIAGTGTSGFSGDGGPAINAQIDWVLSIVTDNAGNIYFLDQGGDRLRKINTAGIITTIATAVWPPAFPTDGVPMPRARFSNMSDLAYDPVNNFLYVACEDLHLVRKVNLASGIVTTIAGIYNQAGNSGDGGAGTAARLNSPHALAVDNAGNVYIVDKENHKIRKVTPAGIISTFAGTGAIGAAGDGGPATAAQFDATWDVACDNAGNVYISEQVGSSPTSNTTIRKVNPAGIITRYAGVPGFSGYNGEDIDILSAWIGPYNISIDADGIIYLTEQYANRIRKIYCPDIVITKQPPSDVTVCSGQSAFIDIEATGAHNAQWQVNTGSGWTNITNNATYSGATIAGLTINTTPAMNGYQYRCHASSGCKDAFTTVTTLKVTTAATPSITIAASANNICEGTQVTFTITGAGNGGANPFYTWVVNGYALGGYANTFTYRPQNGDRIVCYMRSSEYCVTTSYATSNTINMVVTTVTKPTINISTPTTNICTGTPATFTATVTNNGTSPVYQWKKNGVNVGTNSTTYTDNTLTNNDRITCDLTCGKPCGAGTTTLTASSNTIAMTVGSPSVPPSIKIFAPDCFLLFWAFTGDPVTLTAAVTNAGNAPVYQWKINGVNVGTNSPTLTITIPLDAIIDPYEITCVLTSNSPCKSVATATSNSIGMIQQVTPALNIISSGDLCAGGPVAFTVSGSNWGDNPTFQWRKNGVIVGTNSTTYTDNGLNNNDFISCVVTVTGIQCATTNTASAGIQVLCGPCTNTGPIINTIHNSPNSPAGIASDNSGNVYVAEMESDRIIKITPTGVVTTVAGGIQNAYSGDGGLATAAGLDQPTNVTLDNAGNIYFIDQLNKKIRRIDAVTGIITTIANGNTGNSGDGGPVAAAQFGLFSDIDFDNAGNLYIADFQSNVIRKVNTAGIVTRVAGTGFGGYSGDGGLATSAQLNRPFGVYADNAGNIYIADNGNYRIRKVDAAGIITTYAGNGAAGTGGGDNGPAFAANLRYPYELTMDNAGNLYIADGTNGVRKVSPNGTITRFSGNGDAGQNGDGGPALLAGTAAYHITTDPNGNVFITDFGGLIRKIGCNLVTIYEQPVDFTICSATANLSFNMRSCNATNLQWQVNTGTGGWTDISNNAMYSGAASQTLTITGANGTMNNYQYRCRAQNECITLFTDPAKLSIKAPAAAQVSIATPFTTICSGAPAVFTATPVEGGTAPVYQWKKNGTNVGTNSNTYTDNAIVNGDIITCVLTSNAACLTLNPATSNAITMAVNPVTSPTISIAPSAAAICAGTPVTFTPTATNGGTGAFYQWQKNGTDVGSGTTYTDNALNNGDVVQCIFISNYACATANEVNSNTVTMTINPVVTPTIFITPSATTICAGTLVTFTSVITNGGATPAYQWKKNGVNVGTNNPAYSSNTLVQGDIITCVLTVAGTCVTNNPTSNNVVMIVNPVFAPSITIAGSANNICAGTPVTFTATPVNGGTPAYQWKKNGANAGTNSATYTDNGLVQGDIITCELTSSIGCVTSATVVSNTITMAVNTVLVTSVSITPSVNNICAGTPVTFTATPVNGGATPAYQWKKNGANVGTNGTTYTDNALNNNDAITCVITSNSSCVVVPTATSNTVTMAVNPLLAPSISINASSATICAGTPVTFTATPVSGGAAPVYQWKKNGANVGTNSTTYTDNALNNSDAITCIITSNATCVTTPGATSNTVTMIVNPVLAPAVSIISSAATICSGTGVTFTATPVNGGAAPVYQWKKNGANVGTSSTTYTDNTLNNGDAITCILTSGATCITTTTATSNSVNITVNPVRAPTITVNASVNNICSGTPVTFTATAVNGGATPIYQWKKNGVNAGTNSTTYTDNTINNNDVITCIVTSAYACAVPTTAVSNGITMNVNPVVTPGITINTGAAGICAGQPAAFTAVATNGGTAPQYQWRKNGNPVGANSPTYTDNNPATGDVILCRVTSNSVCLTTATAGSNSITETVHTNPVVTLDQTNTLCTGSARVLDAGNFAGYAWNDGSTGKTLSVTNSGTYSVTVTDNNGCKGSSTTTISTMLPQPTGFLASDTAFCRNTSVTLIPLSAYPGYLWNTGSTGSSISVNQPGIYTLQVTGNNGCIGNESVRVREKECLKGFFAPNGFTPDNNRKNDVFKPMLYGTVKKFQLRIYNRYGQMIFQSSDYTRGWDGTINGNKSAAGGYVWICNYQLDGEPEKLEKGTVILIR